MAQLLLQGSNFVNFVGFNTWVGGERHVGAVQVTEWDELRLPSAAICIVIDPELSAINRHLSSRFQH
ncbi:MAG: hypothetical protein ABJA83_01510 [Burkholderiaceae bacterium]